MREVNVWLEEPGLEEGVFKKFVEFQKFKDELSIYAPNGEYMYTVEGSLDEETKQAIDEFDKLIIEKGYNAQSIFKIRDGLYISTETMKASNEILLFVYLLHDDD